MSGGTTFKSTFCGHSVTTLDFNSTNGNRRSQAATVINEHIASLHLRTSVPTKLGGRGNAVAGRSPLTPRWFLLLETDQVRKGGCLYD
jgi:hypothetical protein